MILLIPAGSILSLKKLFDVGDVPEPTDFEGIRERVTSNEDLMADLNLALENGQGVATSRGHSGNDVDHTIQNIPQKGSDTKDHLVEASGDDFEIDHNGERPLSPTKPTFLTKLMS